MGIICAINPNELVDDVENEKLVYSDVDMINVEEPKEE